jgi:hypothetical protein
MMLQFCWKLLRLYGGSVFLGIVDSKATTLDRWFLAHLLLLQLENRPRLMDGSWHISI